MREYHKLMHQAVFHTLPKPVKFTYTYRRKESKDGNFEIYSEKKIACLFSIPPNVKSIRHDYLTRQQRTKYIQVFKLLFQSRLCEMPLP